MNGQQRILRAMRHEPVDRVPVMCQLAIGHYLLHTDVTPVDLWFTSEGFARASVALARRYEFDGILINLPGRDPDWMRSVKRIETNVDGGQSVYFTNGDVARCPADDNVQHVPRQGIRRPTIEEVDPDKVYYDDPHCLGGLKYPFYFGLEPYEADRSRWWPEYMLRTIDLVLGEVGRELSVHGEIFSPFTQLMELFGYEQGLMYLLDEPDRSRAILAAYAEGTADLGVRQARRGVDAVLISSAFAGGGFISKSQYEQFVLPYEAEVVRRIKQEGVPVYTHTAAGWATGWNPGRHGHRRHRHARPATLGKRRPGGRQTPRWRPAVLQGQRRPGQHPAQEDPRRGPPGRPWAVEDRQPGQRLHFV